ncbi:putative invertase inhibitor [Phtheirospermum japonicum]|uniref:Putative invertase inhibitor n=1 Tax=Phtheirospermum japonicum TaxID=374723 RepID=A0A830BW20_9LAMI|nr:putative invertase inhibitor [Phtheirospermum japonicum]
MKPFIIFFLSILIMIQATSSQTLIKSTCKTSVANDPTISYNFCTTSLQAAPASRCATVAGLGSISIRLVRYNITDTRCHVKQLLQNKTLSPYVKQCLDDCFELYSDAILSVKQAMRHYNAKQFDDANVQISSVMDASTTCEGGFADGKVVSPLSKRNNDTSQLSAIALSVVRIVQTGSSKSSLT